VVDTLSILSSSSVIVVFGFSTRFFVGTAKPKYIYFNSSTYYGSLLGGSCSKVSALMLSGAKDREIDPGSRGSTLGLEDSPGDGFHSPT